MGRWGRRWIGIAEKGEEEERDLGQGELGFGNRENRETREVGISRECGEGGRGVST